MTAGRGEGPMNGPITITDGAGNVVRIVSVEEALTRSQAAQPRRGNHGRVRNAISGSVAKAKAATAARAKDTSERPPAAGGAG